jgi:hypothetical protein
VTEPHGALIAASTGVLPSLAIAERRFDAVVQGAVI